MYRYPTSSKSDSHHNRELAQVVEVCHHLNIVENERHTLHKEATVDVQSLNMTAEKSDRREWYLNDPMRLKKDKPTPFETYTVYKKAREI